MAGSKNDLHRKFYVVFCFNNRAVQSSLLSV